MKTVFVYLISPELRHTKLLDFLCMFAEIRDRNWFAAKKITKSMFYCCVASMKLLRRLCSLCALVAHRTIMRRRKKERLSFCQLGIAMYFVFKLRFEICDLVGTNFPKSRQAYYGPMFEGLQLNYLCVRPGATCFYFVHRLPLYCGQRVSRVRLNVLTKGIREGL